MKQKKTFIEVAAAFENIGVLGNRLALLQFETELSEVKLQVIFGPREWDLDTNSLV